MYGLSLCSWNANGINSKLFEFKTFVEKHCPDIILLQETHLRPSQRFNIHNYNCYRNDRITEGPASGGTLILVKNTIPHFMPHSPPLQHIEATTVTLNPPNVNPLTITSIYIPPHSDKLLFTLDLENILQINSNCVIFGDFNATHNAWNCSQNSTRGTQLKNFTDTLNINIAFPNMPTRYGNHSSNTLDIALINNFNFPYDITSISDLSSDHNPVFLNFSLCNITHMDKPRAITTCWSTFHKNLDKNIHFADILNINNPHTLEDKITQFTDAVRSAHFQASKPITSKVHSYTPQHIRDLITLKNRARKLYHNTLNPIYKTEANRLQAHIKKQIKIYKQQVWNDRLKALNTQDNSIWQIQKNFRNSKSNIPTLSHASGIATSDDQKANALANSFKANYTENKSPDHYTNNIDSDVTSTLENFFDNPPTTSLAPTNTDEPYGTNLGWLPERQIHWSCFLDIEKAFDRVWISGLIYKLITYNFPAPLIHIINSYLVNRTYKVRVNNTFSLPHRVNIGVTQGSLLGPILFNIYLNDIPSHPQTMLNLYADDTAILATFKNHKTVTSALNKHLALLETYFNQWKIKINVNKTVAVLFTKRIKPIKPPTLYSTPLQWSQSTKYLGLVLDKKLTWKQHILHARDKFRHALRLIYPLICRNSEMDMYNKVLLYTAVLRPIISYGCPVWGYAAKTNINILEVAQNSIIRTITKANRYTRNSNIYKALKLPPFKNTSKFSKEILC
ncbi:probable RNA-directed DNA polymerase from transposon BS [Trichonephila clavipes]|nr:probable RNA-directed DNA polymerase from transposon BS [Trichonephila clavipes]